MDNEFVMPMVLLVDTSESMQNIDYNTILKRMKECLQQDHYAPDWVKIAMMSFNKEVELLSDFVSAPEMPIPKLVLHKGSDMAKGIQAAADLLETQIELYKDNTETNRLLQPSIIIISDAGYSSESCKIQEAVKRVEALNQRQKMYLLCSDNCDLDKAFEVTELVLKLKVLEDDFSFIFPWEWVEEMNDYYFLKTYGIYRDLPDDAIKAKEDRAIDEGWY